MQNSFAEKIGKTKKSVKYSKLSKAKKVMDPLNESVNFYFFVYRKIQFTHILYIKEYSA